MLANTTNKSICSVNTGSITKTTITRGNHKTAENTLPNSCPKWTSCCHGLQRMAANNLSVMFENDWTLNWAAGKVNARCVVNACHNIWIMHLELNWWICFLCLPGFCLFSCVVLQCIECLTLCLSHNSHFSNNDTSLAKWMCFYMWTHIKGGKQGLWGFVALEPVMMSIYRSYV